MQTFLPYSSFVLSAKALDNRRLNKQIVEVEQIHNAFTGASRGWRNHPAVRMWRGYNGGLAAYGLACYAEWMQRYINGRRGGKPLHASGERILTTMKADEAWPAWLGDNRLHSSHRAALLYKNNDWYSRFGWPETPATPDERGRLPYWWPV